jgi:membrane associated rhomboid family serine protease
VTNPPDPQHRDAQVDGRDETAAERADRNFSELLQELRVAQTGVQILFAFLLTLPFTQRFGRLDVEQRAVYLSTLVATTLATACLIGPVSQHRVLFRLRRKPELVKVANRLAIVGLAFLLVSVIGAVYLIFDVVVGAPVAGPVAGLLGLLMVLIWYIQPLWERRHGR